MFRPLPLYDAHLYCCGPDEARRLAPAQALYHFGAGLLALNARDWIAAQRAFERAMELGHADAERVASFRLWRARALDAAGQRTEAIVGYRSVGDGAADPAVIAAARKNTHAPWRPRAVAIEWNMLDVAAP